MVGSALWMVLAALAAFCVAFVVLLPRKGRATTLVRLPRTPAFELPFVRELRRRRKREELQQACASELPEFLDMLTLGLLAGLSFDLALDLYCAHATGPLARALKAAQMSWRMGLTTRAQALERLGSDLESEAFQSFATAVTEAMSFGSPLAAVLERLAVTLREMRRSEVEEQIEKAPVKMLIPLGTLIVPAMMLAILGPIMASTTAVM